MNNSNNNSSSNIGCGTILFVVALICGFIATVVDVVSGRGTKDEVIIVVIGGIIIFGFIGFIIYCMHKPAGKSNTSEGSKNLLPSKSEGLSLNLPLTLQSDSGKEYTLIAHIKSGGEGSIYETDDPKLVAKIYHADHSGTESRLPEIEKKIKYMVNHRIPCCIPNGTVIVTWPQDILYQNGSFVGYVMPKISDAKPIYLLNRGYKSASSFIPNYDWKMALKISKNLAYIVSFLHSKGIVIGDMNSDNLLVYADGLVAIIDSDSFDLLNEAENIHYKCSVGTEEYLPPELQGRNLRRENVQFTKQSDDFALAVHIFQLLMNNMHPFNARVITDYKQSKPVNDQNYNIAVGNCPFVRQIQDCTTPIGAPDLEDLLPEYLVQDFDKTFNYQLNAMDEDYGSALNASIMRRTSSSKWHQDLKQLLESDALVQCSVNPVHYYLKEKKSCALCAAEEQLSKMCRK